MFSLPLHYWSMTLLPSFRLCQEIVSRHRPFLLSDHAMQGYDGSLPASVREKNLRSFQEGSGQRILVATDAVARGLHIGGVDAVVNADFPLTTVEYLHRLGFTGSCSLVTWAKRSCFIHPQCTNVASSNTSENKKRWLQQKNRQ